MAEIAKKDEYLTDADGIRRKIVAGSPIPDHMAAQISDLTTETVPTASLREVVVDAEASKPQAQRAAEGASTVGMPTGQEDAGKAAAKAAKK
jgi:hypothetical protein